MTEWEIHTAELREKAPLLHAGDRVLLSGTVYTARDAAHKRIFGLLEEGKPLPFSLQNAVIYYAGPTPAPEGLPIGSCGPTTSARMDPYAPRMLDLGLCGMVGKGERSPAVCEAIARNGSVYFCAIGGAGALAKYGFAAIDAGPVCVHCNKEPVLPCGLLRTTRIVRQGKGFINQ